MERLPKFLMKAIDCACEEYGMITYSFHGDNDKTRISIMFSNTDNKQVKRKSGSTRRRDNKRLKEFNDTINDTHVLNVNEIESIDTDSMNIDACTHGTVNECEERTMNTDIPLFGASSFTHSMSIENVGENIERCTVNKEVTVNKPVKPVDDRNLPVGETHETIDFCKRSRISGDVLIGKISDMNLIVTCNVNRKSIETVDKRDGRYEHYERLLFKDFDDITETDFNTDKAKEAIELMIRYVRCNKLSTL
ncbi:unnamed protein product [Mytilus coruscus]|uniref:Uncharacterized protein n=1 Tax=Mytilus coruscus TaxID=42192 RepID=A0A6J8DN81_MYTCO|nr:unnamed protein product [Mytilus coruscus]